MNDCFSFNCVTFWRTITTFRLNNTVFGKEYHPRLFVFLTNRLLTNHSRGLFFAFVLLDYSKACANLNHNLLICKLLACGASDSWVTWFSSYLHDHLQHVKNNYVVSNILHVNVGLPKENVFGPQLFNVYINDFFY